MNLARLSVVGIALFAFVACDANAKNKNKGPQKSAAELKPSQAYESCSSSGDCAGALRCFSGQCIANTEVLLGEYYAHVGDVSLAKKNLARAAEAYDEAVKQYKAKNKQPPPRLYCGWGRALLADERDADKPELAAKVLHRCLRGAPIGSALRGQALSLLAQLDELGLNPVTLPSKEDATKYLKGARKPAADKVKVAVTSTVGAKRGHDELVKLMQDAALKPQYVACWTAHFAASKKPTLVATFPYKSRFKSGPFDDQDGHYIKMEKLTPPGDPAAAAGVACVKAIIEPLAKKIGHRKGSTWAGNITITLAE